MDDKSKDNKVTPKKSNTIKPITKKTNTSKSKSASSKSNITTKKTTTPKKKTTTSKSIPKENKGNKKTLQTPIKGAKTIKKKTLPKKVTSKKKGSNLRVKKESELTTLEALEASVEGKPINEKEKLGKAYYLIFAIVFYTGAFFYINNVVYNNADLLQSSIFAFAALFIVFVLLLFNVHMMFINFYRLPFKRLFKQSKHELKKEIIFSVGKNKVQTGLNKYRAIVALTLYVLISIALMYSVIAGGIANDNKILSIITRAILTEFIFLTIVCSWQYLFNIIPSLLDKSLDAKNGFILTLSATVMIIYVLFGIFDITYLSEIMIFILIIGFVALLGVNLNMIVGEINIFQNLRDRKNNAVTRIVFLIFFGFHIYVILYASVVAYSIYKWDPNSYNFAYVEMENIVVDDLYDFNSNPIGTVYDSTNIEITTVYNSQGFEITDFIDEDGYAIKAVYDIDLIRIYDFYESGGTNRIQIVYDEEGIEYYNFFYHDGT